MGIYILFFIIILLLSFKIKKGKYSIYDFIIIILLVLLSGLRACGTDYFLYKNYYDIITDATIAASRTGIGFAYLRIFFHNVLHLDYQYLIFFVSIVTNICLYIFIKEKSNKPGLALLCLISFGFYTDSFNMFRQIMSLALVLLGSLYFEKGKRIIAAFLYIMGFLIHSVSIIGILFYSLNTIFRKIKINPLLVIITSLFIYNFYDGLFDIIMNYFPQLSIYQNKTFIPGIGTYLIIAINFIIFFLLSLYRRKITEEDSLYNKYFNYYAIGIILSSFQLKNYLFMRVVLYFTIFMPFLIAEFYEKVDMKKNKPISFIFYACLFLYFIIYINSFGGVVPYYSFFAS